MYISIQNLVCFQIDPEGKNAKFSTTFGEIQNTLTWRSFYIASDTLSKPWRLGVFVAIL